MENIFEEIRKERIKQNKKWGEQNHPSLHPSVFDPKRQLRLLNLPDQEIVKQRVDAEAKSGNANWSSILLEEVLESIDAKNDYERRGELIQTAAVIVQWIECLDRNNRCELPTDLDIEKFTDDSLMPFGKHKGIKMANIPADYLLFILENNLVDGSLKDYIIENKESLQKESGFGGPR